MTKPDPTNPRHIAFARAGPMGWAWLCSGGAYKRPPHVRFMHERIADLLASPTGGRLLLEEPPRHSKTETVRAVVGWFMGTHPGRSVIYGTHTKTLADRFGRLVRSDLDEYGMAVFGQTLDASSRAKSDWALTGGGEFFGVGVGGSPHGRGSALLVTDDLVPNAEAARSKVQMEAIDDFLRSDLFSRRSAGWYGHIGIQTRWSTEDPHGLLMRLYPDLYDVVRLPAIATDGDPIGREPGEALWPDAFPLDVLAEIRQGMHPYRWSAIYQQAPTPAEGNVWRRAWWADSTYEMSDDRTEVVDHAGAMYRVADLRRFVVVDLACTEKETSDYVVIGCFGVTTERKPRMFMLDLLRKRMEGPGINPAVRAMLAKWSAPVAYYEHAGQQIMAAQYARDEGLPVLLFGRSKDCDIQLSGDKVAVSMDATPFVAAGRLLVPVTAPWLADWEAEMLAFPGAHDDQVDVTAVACHVVLQRTGRVSVVDAYKPPVTERAHDVRNVPPSERHRDEDRDARRKHGQVATAWGGPAPRAW